MLCDQIHTGEKSADFISRDIGLGNNQMFPWVPNRIAYYPLNAMIPSLVGRLCTQTQPELHSKVCFPQFLKRIYPFHASKHASSLSTRSTDLGAEV